MGEHIRPWVLKPLAYCPDIEEYNGFVIHMTMTEESRDEYEDFDV